MSKTSRLLALAAVAAIGFSGAAHAQTGHVATACKAEIAKYCAGKEHGHREVRGCLEAQKENLSETCMTALESTGAGKGKGMMKAKPEAKKAPETNAAPEAAPAAAPEPGATMEPEAMPGSDEGK